MAKTKKTKLVRETRQKSADERNLAWRALSVKEQVASLDRRLGKNVGAKKQRARILAADKS